MDLGFKLDGKILGARVNAIITPNKFGICVLIECFTGWKMFQLGHQS